MPSQSFQDYNQNTPITAAWLNGVNAFLFGSTGNNASTSPAAWCRFNGTTSTIQQSYNVASLVRNSAGNYTITFQENLVGSANCYQITTNLAGVAQILSETANSVTFQTLTLGSAPTDCTIICLTVFGAYLPPF